MRLAWIPLLCAALTLLPGCPEERPGAANEIPAQRIPPAMALEPPSRAPAAPGVSSAPAPAPPPGTSAPPASRRAHAAPAPSPGRTAPRP